MGRDSSDHANETVTLLPLSWAKIQTNRSSLVYLFPGEVGRAKISTGEEVEIQCRLHERVPRRESLQHNETSAVCACCCILSNALLLLALIITVSKVNTSSLSLSTPLFFRLSLNSTFVGVSGARESCTLMDIPVENLSFPSTICLTPRHKDGLAGSSTASTLEGEKVVDSFESGVAVACWSWWTTGVKVKIPQEHRTKKERGRVTCSAKSKNELSEREVMGRGHVSSSR
jgi:hypothetical protein